MQVMKIEELINEIIKQYNIEDTGLVPVALNACLASKLIIHCVNAESKYAKLQLNLIEEFIGNVKKEVSMVETIQTTKSGDGKIDQKAWLVYTLLPFDTMELISRNALFVNEIRSNSQGCDVEYSMALSYLRSARYSASLLVRQRMSSIDDISIISDVKRHIDDLPIIPRYDWEIKEQNQ